MSKVSKIQIMEMLSKNFTSYVSTQWLKTPIEGASGKCPSDLMKDGKLSKVHELLKKEVEVKKSK